MRRLFPAIIVFFFSCNHKSRGVAPTNFDTLLQASEDTLLKVDDAYTAEKEGTTCYVWLVDFDNKTKKRNPSFREELLNVDSIIKGINELYPYIKLEKVKMSGDTLVTKITDSEYFSQRMGSTGAGLYLANVILNLSALSAIKYVKIDMKEGGHAGPGVWSAEDFDDFREIR